MIPGKRHNSRMRRRGPARGHYRPDRRRGCEGSVHGNAHQACSGGNLVDEGGLHIAHLDDAAKEIRATPHREKVGTRSLRE
jgi:hypothetical protein